MKRADRLAAEFIQKTSLYCAYIAGPIERRPVKVFYDRLTIEPREGNKFIYWRRYWVPGGEEAHELVTRFAALSWADKRNFPNWFSLDVDTAESRLRAIAAELGIGLTDNSDVVKRAAEVIARYDDKLFQMKKSGQMKPLNKAYKAYRMANQRLSKQSLHYEDWLDHQLEPVLNALVQEIFRRERQLIDISKKRRGPPPPIFDVVKAM